MIDPGTMYMELDRYIRHQKEPDMSNEVKTCDNCIYRRGEFVEAGLCMKTGQFLRVQRGFPNDRCDKDFSGWVAMPEPAKRWWEFWK